MVTLFVITALAAVGLPMLNGFVGEFLILSGSMQSAIAHHVVWTVLATTGVILSAAYMLWMIQRVFYGGLGLKPERPRARPQRPRTRSPSGPSSSSSSLMGLASPYWMRAIDTAGVSLAQAVPNQPVTSNRLTRSIHATQLDERY